MLSHFFLRHRFRVIQTLLLAGCVKNAESLTAGLTGISFSSFGFEAHAGTVYHQLGMLSELGIIRGEEQETRSKYARRGATAYEMTEKGTKAFKKFKKKWREPLEYAYKNLNM